LGKSHSLSDAEVRREFFRQGLLFGPSAFDQRRTYLEFAENVVTEYLDSSGSAASQIRSGFEKSIERMPLQGLVEFFSRPNAGQELLKAAIALEDACHARTVVSPRDLVSLEAKMVIGLISDYAGLKRQEVLGTREDSSSVVAVENHGETFRSRLL
jgi:hypothetical protein